MPQVDIVTFVSQNFWVAIFFLFFVSYITLYFLAFIGIYYKLVLRYVLYYKTQLMSISTLITSIMINFKNLINKLEVFLNSIVQSREMYVISKYVGCVDQRSRGVSFVAFKKASFLRRRGLVI